MVFLIVTLLRLSLTYDCKDVRTYVHVTGLILFILIMIYLIYFDHDMI